LRDKVTVCRVSLMGTGNPIFRRKRMKTSTALLVVVSLAILVFAGSLAAFAEDLSPEQLKILESNGIPLYPGATYRTGDNEAATVMWFGTQDPPGKVMDWYKDKLSGWSEITVNSSRVIYKGPAGADPKDLSTWPYVFTRITDETPGSTDSEITIRIPR